MVEFASEESILSMLGTRDLITRDIFWQKYLERFLGSRREKGQEVIGTMVLRVSSAQFGVAESHGYQES